MPLCGAKHLLMQETCQKEALMFEVTALVERCVYFKNFAIDHKDGDRFRKWLRRARSWDSSSPGGLRFGRQAMTAISAERHAVGTLHTYFIANSMMVFVDCGNPAISRVFSGGGANSLCRLEPAN